MRPHQVAHQVKRRKKIHHKKSDNLLNLPVKNLIYLKSYSDEKYKINLLIYLLNIIFFYENIK